MKARENRHGLGFSLHNILVLLASPDHYLKIGSKKRFRLVIDVDRPKRKGKKGWEPTLGLLGFETRVTWANTSYVAIGNREEGFSGSMLVLERFFSKYKKNECLTIHVSEMGLRFISLSSFFIFLFVPYSLH